MTYPFKTVFTALEYSNVVLQELSKILGGKGLTSTASLAYPAASKNNEAIETLRAIMGQDVEALKLASSHYFNDLIITNADYKECDYLRRELIKGGHMLIDHLASTGRICGVPDGWVMVPREPTDAMLDAVYPTPSSWERDIHQHHKFNRRRLIESYKAMIEAAASTPGGDDE